MIKTFFKNGTAFLIRKQGSILGAAAVIMATVLLSRVLGLFRDRLLATYFSVDDLGVYFAAFRLPNLLFELLIMGVLSSAFIPVFTNYLVKGDSDHANRIASGVINLSVLAMLILIVPLYVFARQISYLLVPGFSENERVLMIEFTRIMLLGQLLPLIIGNYITGILQSHQRFLLPALAPVIYNVGIIIGIVFLSSSMGLYGAVWGVVIGAVLYLLIQLPLLWKLGYSHKLILNIKDTGVREVLKLMLPRTFGLGISQIDTTVDLILASFLGSRSITIFNFAQHLQQVPIGLFGATFAQATLPTLSISAAKHEMENFKEAFLASLNQILFFVLPASVMLMVLRIPIVRLVFGAAKFDWAATVSTGRTVSFFAVSIFAQSLVQLFARGFYALYDTKTPVIIGSISVVVNTVLSVVFVRFLNLPVWSLAISTSVASVINLLLLAISLHVKIKGFNLQKLLIPPFKMFLASFVTGIFLYIPLKLLDQLVFDTTRVVDLIMLTGVAMISGLSVYIFLAWFLDIEEVGLFFRLLKKMKTVPQIFANPSSELVNGDNTPVG